ncbi:MAG: amino acid permease, partial [Planctomycetota bacterium]
DVAMNAKTMDTTAPTVQHHQFGTFAGVFTPSLLTILGVIMFLRVGFVVGQAGIRNAVLILLLAELIVLLTATSMGAIATNTRVRGGGAYFLISRVLGPEFGGSIGLALFLAQALSLPFYLLGFTESLVTSFPVLRPYFLLLALGSAAMLFVINYISAAAAIRTQYVVMALLAASVVSFLGGAIVLFDAETFATNWEPAPQPGSLGFWAVFALYFPAVTGIMAGVNMSGDLRRPARSLVRGTFLAIIVGAAVYLLQMLLIGGSQARGEMIARPYEMLLANALWGTSFLVMGGVFAATLSSAFGSLLGAPRVLQALARDRVLPALGFFAKGTTRGDEPRRAMWLTFAIAASVIVLASGPNARQAFDHVASVITMFFLSTYGMINLAAFVESVGANPSFRPRFRYRHWSASLLGAVCCLAVMLLIDAVAATVASVVVAGLYVLVSRRMYESAFGDARRGLLYSLIARSLRRLRSSTVHPKNWRPTLLVLSGNPATRQTLVRFAAWFEAGRGVMTAAVIIVGDFRRLAERQQTVLASMERSLRDLEVTAFAEVVIAGDFDEGVRMLVQAHSIGPLKPNTVVTGWPQSPERVIPFVRHLRDIQAFRRSIVCIIDRGLERPVPSGARIDIWWRGQGNGSLMLILAHLLTTNWEWKGARIRVLRLVKDNAGVEPATAALREVVRQGRVEAEVSVVVSTAPFASVLREHSADGNLLMLGLDLPDDARAEEFHRRHEEMLKDMPTTVLVRSNGEADLLA